MLRLHALSAQLTGLGANTFPVRGDVSTFIRETIAYLVSLMKVLSLLGLAFISKTILSVAKHKECFAIESTKTVVERILDLSWSK